MAIVRLRIVAALLRDRNGHDERNHVLFESYRMNRVNKKEECAKDDFTNYLSA